MLLCYALLLCAFGGTEQFSRVFPIYPAAWGQWSCETSSRWFSTSGGIAFWCFMWRGFINRLDALSIGQTVVTHVMVAFFSTNMHLQLYVIIWCQKYTCFLWASGKVVAMWTGGDGRVFCPDFNIQKKYETNTTQTYKIRTAGCRKYHRLVLHVFCKLIVSFQNEHGIGFFFSYVDFVFFPTCQVSVVRF